MQRVEVTPQARQADDVHGDLVGPVIYLDDTVVLQLRGHAVYQFDGLGPEDWVKVADVAEAEGGRDVLALELVLVALDDDEAVTENGAEDLTDSRHLLEVITLVHQHVCERFGIGQEKPVRVKERGNADDAFIGDLIHEFEKRSTGRSLEGHKAVVDEREATLITSDANMTSFTWRILPWVSGDV